MGSSSSTIRKVNVDRTLLQTVLMTVLEDNVSFRKDLKRTRSPPTGSAPGSAGSCSPADCQCLDTSGRAVYGKTVLTPVVQRLAPPGVPQALCVTGEQERPFSRPGTGPGHEKVPPR